MNFVSLLRGHRIMEFAYGARVPISIDPRVKTRLDRVLAQPELRGVDYSAFIARACEAAETEIANRKTVKW